MGLGKGNSRSLKTIAIFGIYVRLLGCKLIYSSSPTQIKVHPSSLCPAHPQPSPEIFRPYFGRLSRLSILPKIDGQT